MPSNVDGSITWLIRQLREGNEEAAEPLWNCYFEQLIRLAHARLAPHFRSAEADEEDAALSAFYSFCQGAKEGRFPRLGDRHDVWRLLVALTGRKVTDQIRRTRAQKRGRGRILDEAALERLDLDKRLGGVDQLPGNDPTPEIIAIMAEQHQHLLDILRDKTLQSVAVWKLEGYSNKEIALRLGCCERTVAYKLRLIRLIWERAG